MALQFTNFPFSAAKVALEMQMSVSLSVSQSVCQSVCLSDTADTLNVPGRAAMGIVPKLVELN